MLLLLALVAVAQEARPSLLEIGPIDSTTYVEIAPSDALRLQDCYDTVAPGAFDWEELDGRVELRVVVRGRQVRLVTVAYSDSQMEALTPCLARTLATFDFGVRRAKLNVPVRAVPAIEPGATESEPEDLPPGYEPVDATPPVEPPEHLSAPVPE